MTTTYRVSGQLAGRKAYATRFGYVTDRPSGAFVGTRTQCEGLARAMAEQRSHRTATHVVFHDVTPTWTVEVAP